jgi:hypothetical protein
MPKPAAKGPKKEYSSPKLTVHGTVEEMTKHTGATGSLDGGHLTGKTKTHI